MPSHMCSNSDGMGTSTAGSKLAAARSCCIWCRRGIRRTACSWCGNNRARTTGRNAERKVVEGARMVAIACSMMLLLAVDCCSVMLPLSLSLFNAHPSGGSRLPSGNCGSSLDARLAASPAPRRAPCYSDPFELVRGRHTPRRHFLQVPKPPDNPRSSSNSSPSLTSCHLAVARCSPPPPPPSLPPPPPPPPIIYILTPPPPPPPPSDNGRRNDERAATAKCLPQKPRRLRQHHHPDREEAAQARLPVQCHLRRYVLSGCAPSSYYWPIVPSSA